MITKYNVGDTVLIPLTIRSVIANEENGIVYSMTIHPEATIKNKEIVYLQEGYIHSVLLPEEEPPTEEGRDPVDKEEPPAEEGGAPTEEGVDTDAG